MPKHKPIKFESNIAPSLKSRIKETMKENETAKTVLNATLALAAIGGTLTLAVMAPGLLGEITRSAYRKKKNRYEKYNEIWKRFNYLKQKGNLEFIKEKDGYMVYKLTKKGKKKLNKLIVDEMCLKIPKKWDGKWRLVIFDIPESFAKDRYALRKKLKEMNFYQCQKSVWIHPFPCLEEIEFLKNNLNIKPFVKLFLVEEMTDGKVLYNFKDEIKDVL